MTFPSANVDPTLHAAPGGYGGPPGGYGGPPGGGGYGGPPPGGGYGGPPGGGGFGPPGGGGYDPGGGQPPGGYGGGGFGPPGGPPPPGGFGGGFGPPQGPMGGFDRGYAEGKVKAPAITMMILAGIGALLQLVSMLMNILGTGMSAAGAGGQQDQLAALTSGVIGIVMNLVGIASSAFCFYGLMKMMKLQSRGLAYAAVIASMLPCFGSCWCINIFVGIWALIALSDEAVKQSFR